MLTQQWLYLNLTRNIFDISLLVKAIMSHRQIIFTRPIRSFERTLFTRYLGTFKPVNKLNNVNVNYSIRKLPKSIFNLDLILK